MVAWYLGGTGVTGAKGGASMKRVEQDIGRLLWIMKWGKMGKLVLGLIGVLLLVVGAAMTEGGNGNKKNK
jgi:glucose uptake protein GlcU